MSQGCPLNTGFTAYLSVCLYVCLSVGRWVGGSVSQSASQPSNDRTKLLVPEEARAIAICLQVKHSAFHETELFNTALTNIASL